MSHLTLFEVYFHLGHSATTKNQWFRAGNFLSGIFRSCEGPAKISSKTGIYGIEKSGNFDKLVFLEVWKFRVYRVYCPRGMKIMHLLVFFNGFVISEFRWKWHFFDLEVCSSCEQFSSLFTKISEIFNRFQGNLSYVYVEDQSIWRGFWGSGEIWWQKCQSVKKQVFEKWDFRVNGNLNNFQSFGAALKMTNLNKIMVMIRYF